MAITFQELIPNPEDLLALEPEEIGGIVLQWLSMQESQNLNRYNFGLDHTVKGYPQEYRKRISRVLMEGWVWLEREGLLAPRPGSQGEWVFITRRGEELSKAQNFEAYRKSAILPRALLHGRLVEKVWAPFLRGEYETAIFVALREVEVYVREASNATNNDIGVSLMRAAFNYRDGQLTDSTYPKTEREAMAHFFAGVIGTYKNPSSHRSVDVDAEEALEIIVIASHLLRVVDSRISAEQ